MPDWGLLRQRDRDVFEDARRSMQLSLEDENGRLRNSGHARKRDRAPVSEQLTVFQSHELEATGDMFFKVSRFQRSKRYHAELRGCTIVVFRSQSPIHALHATIDDVMAVIPVHEYKIDIVEMNDDGSSRIYVVPTKYPDSMVMFIRVSSEPRMRAWRCALSRIRASPLPSLSTLNIESVIGRGGGGKVFVVNWQFDGRTYALKVIDKGTTFKNSKAFRHVASERMLMEKVGFHPFLLQMHFAFQSEHNLYIGTPFCPGGDLASYIRAKGDRSIPMGDNEVSLKTLDGRQKKMNGRLSEEQTRRIACEIILGLEHLHRRGIVYRDLKPENVFIDETGHIRIGDYGLAKMLTLSSCGRRRLKTASICGTRNYLPPEMLHGHYYSFEADVWSFGVMLYRMLCGTFPFDGRRTKEVFTRIKEEKVIVPCWLSVEARDLLFGLLEKRPDRRLTMSEIKSEKFFAGVQWEDVLHKRTDACIQDLEMGTTLAEALENFELSKLQGVTVGEYVSESDTRGPEKTASETATHRRNPGRMMIGFEYMWVRREETEEQPIAIKKKSSGLLSRLASSTGIMEYDNLPLSPRSPFQGAGKQ